MNQNYLALIDEAVEVISQNTVHRPRVGLILGSGLGQLAERVRIATSIPYREIPRFPQSTAPDHAGRLVMGRLSGHTVAVMQGRVHFYEGYTMAEITFPVRVMQRMGVRTLIVSNAAGGLNPEFSAGEMMLITDHISMVSLTGNNPLVGPNIPELGVRFPNMSQAYDLGLQASALSVADREGIRMREGVYACVSGPSFETPAEIRMLRSMGADAVGMSTAPEVTVAQHAGMRVLGFSAITNIAIATSASGKETTAQEVLDAGAVIAPQLSTVIEGVLDGLPKRSGRAVDG